MNLEVKNGLVKLYHYSDKAITDTHISTRKSPGLQSIGAFKMWGRSRAFFYGKKDGYKYDHGISTDYLYICYIDKNKIYNVYDNPKNIKSDLKKHAKESFYLKTKELGYSAWYYYLDNNLKCPIVISFEPVQISLALKKTYSGYIPLHEKNLDYPIGYIELNGEKWFVMQKSDYIKSLYNTYLTKESDPEIAMKTYKKPLEYFNWKKVNFYDEYEIYKNEL